MASPLASLPNSYAPGARVSIRDQEWLIWRIDRTSSGAAVLGVVGLSPLVEGKEARFIDTIERETGEIAIVDPRNTKAVGDASPHYSEPRLVLAAALHGAAHQQVQQLQIVVPRQERPLGLPGFSIRFFRKRDFATTPLQSRKGHSGMLPVSTPEATALDLVRYSRFIGGLDAVLTVIAELAESINPAKLAAATASESETAQIQRLGWLLDHLGQTTLADALHAALPTSKPLPRAALDAGAPRTGPITGNRWRIMENAPLDADVS
jgi:predicted transcriptional regulator of viral defense system